MRIINVFDAAIEGNYQEFMRLYTGNVNVVNKYTRLNLLQTVLVETYNEIERLKIIAFLLNNNIDINYKDRKYNRNALHAIFFNFLEGDAGYLLDAVIMLLEAGIEVNAIDKYQAIPLQYAITVCKLKTEEMKDIYVYMLRAGSDYNMKNIFGKSCIDYAKELTWRTEFIKIAEEMKND